MTCALSQLSTSVVRAAGAPRSHDNPCHASLHFPRTLFSLQARQRVRQAETAPCRVRGWQGRSWFRTMAVGLLTQSDDSASFRPVSLHTQPHGELFHPDAPDAPGAIPSLQRCLFSSVQARTASFQELPRLSESRCLIRESPVSKHGHLANGVQSSQQERMVLWGNQHWLAIHSAMPGNRIVK